MTTIQVTSETSSSEDFESSIRAISTGLQLCTGNQGLINVRAAEGGFIDCAKILIDNNADIDALNFQGQTPFHVVSLSMIILKAAET